MGDRRLTKPGTDRAGGALGHADICRLSEENAQLHKLTTETVKVIRRKLRSVGRCHWRGHAGNLRTREDLALAQGPETVALLRV